MEHIEKKTEERLSRDKWDEIADIIEFTINRTQEESCGIEEKYHLLNYVIKNVFHPHSSLYEEITNEKNNVEIFKKIKIGGLINALFSFDDEKFYDFIKNKEKKRKAIKDYYIQTLKYLFFISNLTHLPEVF